jgi:hypothetical protein
MQVAHLLEADCTPWARRLCNALPTAEGAAADGERCERVIELLLAQSADLIEETLRAAPQLAPALPLNDHVEAIGAWPEALQPAAWRAALRPARAAQATAYLAPHRRSFQPRHPLPADLPPAATAAIGDRLRRLLVIGTARVSESRRYDGAFANLLAAATGLQELDVAHCPLERYNFALPATLVELRAPHKPGAPAIAAFARLKSLTLLHVRVRDGVLGAPFAKALRALPQLRSFAIQGVQDDPLGYDRARGRRAGNLRASRTDAAQLEGAVVARRAGAARGRHDRARGRAALHGRVRRQQHDALAAGRNRAAAGRHAP